MHYTFTLLLAVLLAQPNDRTTDDIKAATKAIGANPKDVKALTLRAELYESSDKYAEAVGRFMCMVRVDGIAKARKAMLKIGNDRRVPMRQVYDLYKGDLKPEDVFAATKADKPSAVDLSRRLFYAHLYVGIYHDLLGHKKQALEHLNKATDDHRISHYMWDVARVHRDLLKKERKQ
jgi:tetratricopeptide (TPR) repeat protein